MMNPDDAVNASATRIIMVRGQEIRKSRTHTCRKRDCSPMCEMDLINDGRLPRSAKIYDSRVYVCIYQKVHVCCPDRCEEYHDRPDGVCPITGLYHGQADSERGYVVQEKRTTRYRPELTTLKRATAVEPEALSQEEQLRFLSGGGEPLLKNRKLEADTTPPASDNVVIKQEPGTQKDLSITPSATKVSTALPESGFYSFGSAVTKKKEGKGGGKRGVGRGGGGGAGRKKPVPLSQRRVEAELIVTQLLYSNVRKAINREKKQRLDDNKLKALGSYYKERAGITFPMMVEVEGIKATFDVDIPTLRNLKRDERRVDYYVGIILRTWEIVTSTPWGAQNPGYKFVAHALSVLYKMRSGMKLEGLQLLPFDSYLYALPGRGDLPRYNESYNSSIVTEGMKHIRSAYESALSSGWAPSALSLERI